MLFVSKIPVCHLSSFQASRSLTLMLTWSTEHQFPHQCWGWTFSSYMSWGARRETHFPLLGKEMTDDVHCSPGGFTACLFDSELTLRIFTVFSDPVKGCPIISVKVAQELRGCKRGCSFLQSYELPSIGTGNQTLVIRKSGLHSKSRAISPALVLNLFLDWSTPLSAHYQKTLRP